MSCELYYDYILNMCLCKSDYYIDVALNLTFVTFNIMSV
jgi:hypothetical protein